MVLTCINLYIITVTLLFSSEYDNTEVQVNYKQLQSKKTHQLLVYTDYDTNSLHENTDIIFKKVGDLLFARNDVDL